MNNANQPPANNQPDETNGPSRTGGLLSNYAQKQPIKSDSPISQLPPGAPTQSSTPPGRSFPSQSGLLSQAGMQPAKSGLLSQAGMQPAKSGLLSQAGMQPAKSGLLSAHQQNIIANTLQTVRGWSGKIAAMAGHRVLPPEPPLERYRPYAEVVEAPLLSTQTKAQPWKRSRTVRIVKQIRNRRERWGQTQLGVGRVWRTIGIIVALLAVIMSVSGSAYGYTYYQNELPEVQRLASLQVPQTTRIYDRNYNLLYSAYDTSVNSGGRSTPVTYTEIPKVLQNALIATEDHTFWTNIGIDPTGIVRAASESYGGASGITQQVVKNLTHDTQDTMSRKISEAALAIGLTQEYPKWKILEMYFDIAPFGAQDIGVEAAIEDDFHLMPTCSANFKCTPGIERLGYVSAKDPNDATMALARASLLAGIPNNPTLYDPTLGTTEQDNILARQKHVLDLMVEFGESYGPGPVTAQVAQKAEALSAKMTFSPYAQIKHAPHFVDWIITQLETELGNGDPAAGVDAFVTGGFNIRTTIDVKLENYVEAAVTRHLTQSELQAFTGGYGPLNVTNNVNDAAAVVMNAKTGEVLAMDGSANYNSTNPEVGGTVNATISQDGTLGRQPGSSFKPIVYATALEMGWYPGIVLPDAKTYFPNDNPAGTSVTDVYTPSDYSTGSAASYHPDISPMTLRTAVANSFNVPAVKTLQYVGTENAVVTAERMGLGGALDQDATKLGCKDQTAAELGGCFGMSLVLGTAEVPLLQMTNAYQVFADNGTFVHYQSILDIWDNYGDHLYHYNTSNVTGSRVFSPQVSFEMTSILEDEPARVYEFYPDNALSFADKSSACGYYVNYLDCPYQVAAKTGTTSGFVDNLTMGYTPNIVVGVWAGNANGFPMQNVIGITGAAPIWHSVMEFADEGWCNVETDQVPCTNYSPTKDGVGTQQQFTEPSGLVQQCVSSTNGLAGSSSNCDFMIAGEEPQQAGAAPVTTTTTTNNNGNNNNGNNG